MYRVVVREEVKAEIETISKYTREEWGELQEQLLKGYIRATIELLATFPHTGVRSNRVGVFVKAVQHVPFVIVYELGDHVLIIAQVLHVKRSR